MYGKLQKFACIQSTSLHNYDNKWLGFVEIQLDLVSVQFGPKSTKLDDKEHSGFNIVYVINEQAIHTIVI